MRGHALALAFALVGALFLTGCPKGSGGQKTDAVTTCSSAGQSCVYAPGKLGLCVAGADPAAPIVCQSQH